MVFSWIFSRGKTQLPKNFRQLIDSDALKIVEKLQRAGHETYLVGGCVRDILLGKKPKDFDIASQATPQQVKSLIHRSFIIGRRFRIVIAKRNERHEAASHKSLFPPPAERMLEKEFQITTFRREPVIVDEKINENVFGTPQEDALRRDFTVNALFLDPTHGKIVDFVEGQKDLQQKKLRIIGNPNVRFKEDAIRILRALRFQTRTQLKFDDATYAGLKKHLSELGAAKRERIREEFLKMLREGHISEVFGYLSDLHIWQYVSPTLGTVWASAKGRNALIRLSAALNKTPWPHASQSPLIYLVNYPIYRSSDAGSAILAKVFEELKISKAEQEDLERIQTLINRIEKDPNGENAARIVMRNTRYFTQQCQSFFCIKILADAHVEQFQTLWKVWGPIWEQHMEHYRSARPPTSSRLPQSPHSKGSSNVEGLADEPEIRRRSPSRRRRPRRPTTGS